MNEFTNVKVTTLSCAVSMHYACPRHTEKTKSVIVIGGGAGGRDKKMPELINETMERTRM